MGEEPEFPPASVLALCFIPPVDTTNKKLEGEERDTAIIIAEKMGKHTINFLQFFFSQHEPTRMKYTEITFYLWKRRCPESCLTLLYRGKAAWDVCRVEPLEQSSRRSHLFVTTFRHRSRNDAFCDDLSCDCLGALVLRVG